MYVVPVTIPCLHGECMLAAKYFIKQIYIAGMAWSYMYITVFLFWKAIEDMGCLQGNSLIDP